MAERIPDEALVVRGGLNQAEDFKRKITNHPSGIQGTSVECGIELTVVELAAILPHGQVGVTTVGAIRLAGGDVIRTSGRSQHHATLTGLSPEEASSLFTPTIANPAKKS